MNITQIENWNIEEITGYEVKTTFYTDFSIAERFGLEAIVDTYKTSFESWKTNCEYITELSMVLNWKMFRWFEQNEELYQLYRQLYLEIDDWCINNLEGEDLQYYYFTTD